MSKSIDVVLYNCETKEFSEEKISDYTDYYKLLNCQLFTVTMPSNDISLYVDDEGLFVSGNPVTLITHENGYENMLAGNIVFAGGVDDEGNTLSFEGGIPRASAMVTETNKVVR